MLDEKSWLSVSILIYLKGFSISQNCVQASQVRVTNILTKMFVKTGTLVAMQVMGTADSIHFDGCMLNKLDIVYIQFTAIIKSSQ